MSSVISSVHEGLVRRHSLSEVRNDNQVEYLGYRSLSETFKGRVASLGARAIEGFGSLVGIELKNRTDIRAEYLIELSRRMYPKKDEPTIINEEG